MTNFIAIDLDPQGIYAVTGAAHGAVKVTHAVAWTGDDAPPALTVETAKGIGEKLRDRLKAAGVPPAPAIVAVGRDRIILKELRYPPVPPADEPALIRFQAIKEMSESPEEIVLDYAPLGVAAGERRSMVVAVRKDLFNAIQALCQAAGLKLAGITPRPYAVAAGVVRAFASGAAPAPDSRDEAVAALTLGPGGGEFTVVRRGEVTFTLAIPAPVAASEPMLVAQVRRNLAVYAGQNPGHPIQAVYVSEVDGPWAPRLGAALGVPVHAYDPLARALPGVPAPIRGRFAGAVGLLAGRATNALPINFVSPRQPQTVSDPAKRKIAMVALAAALFLVIGAAGGFWLVGRANADVRELTAKRNELKDTIVKGGPDATRLKAIDAWSKREVVWLDELHDLAERLPDDDGVRVTSLTATPIAVGKDGKQEAQARLELKLAAVGTAPATKLMSAFERDNAGGHKYYVGTNQVIGGLLPATAGTKHNQLVTLLTKVNHREPNLYEPTPRFSAPKKTSGSAGLSAAPPPPVPVEPPVPLETAPEPRAKADPGAGDE